MRAEVVPVMQMPDTQSAGTRTRQNLQSLRDDQEVRCADIGCAGEGGK